MTPPRPIHSQRKKNRATVVSEEKFQMDKIENLNEHKAGLFLL